MISNLINKKEMIEESNRVQSMRSFINIGFPIRTEEKRF